MGTLQKRQGLSTTFFLLASMVSFSFIRIFSSHFFENLITFLRRDSESGGTLVSYPTESTLESIDIHRRHATFYSIFIPSSAEDRDPALAIVKEQLAAAKRSSAWNSSLHELFYNVIGYNATAEIQQECGQQCHLLQFAPEADEALTLQSLHGYCQEHADSFVTFIHDKVSYHRRKEKNDLRRPLTKIVTSDVCQDVEMRKNACDVCGVRVSLLRRHRLLGNMWTARCSYIRKLDRPDEFEQRMDDLMDNALHHTEEEVLKPSVGQFVGSDRYAIDHWVTSHPSARLCSGGASTGLQRPP